MINKKKIKSAKQKKTVSHKGNPLRLSAEFFSRSVTTKRECHDILIVLNGENLQARVLYQARLFQNRKAKEFTRQIKTNGVNDQ